MLTQEQQDGVVLIFNHLDGKTGSLFDALANLDLLNLYVKTTEGRTHIDYDLIEGELLRRFGLRMCGRCEIWKSDASLRSDGLTLCVSCQREIEEQGEKPFRCWIGFHPWRTVKEFEDDYSAGTIRYSECPDCGERMVRHNVPMGGGGWHRNLWLDHEWTDYRRDVPRLRPDPPPPPPPQPRNPS